MSNEYDISNAFNRIETKLIQSMKRNLSKHLEDETLENMNWSMWQTEQLKSLEQFRKENKSIFNDDFDNIDSDIESMLKETYNNASLEQEQKILEAIQKGVFKSTGDSTLSAGFFGLDSNKLTQLISETQGNIRKAETSILRYTNDQYRQIIFDAQVYANTGAGTIKQAVDMATQDFLSKGINSIQYSNGARVNVSSYAEMAIRTANSRAHMYGEGEKRDEWGYHTVLVPNRNGGCPYCVQYQGKVFIDDVWSNGTKAESKGQGYPLLSTAVQGGLFHPNCKDTTVTYFPGINSNVKPPTQEEIKQKIENYNKEQKLKAIDRNIDKYKRLELGSLDESNIEKYHNKRLAWENYKKKFKENSNLSFNNKVTNSNNSSIIQNNNNETSILSLEECKKLIEKDEITFVEEDLKTLDNRLLSENTKQLSELLNKYPTMKEYIKDKTLIFGAETFGDDTVASFRPGDFSNRLSLTLSKRYYSDYNYLIENELKNIDSFYNMPCANNKTSVYTITHEFGHFVETKLIDIYNQDNLQAFLSMKEKATKALTSNNISKAKSIFNSWNKKVADEISQEIYEIAKSNNSNFKLADNLSKYGYTDNIEFFAECFANMECGEVNELGKAMEIYLKQKGIS